MDNNRISRGTVSTETVNMPSEWYEQVMGAVQRNQHPEHKNKMKVCGVIEESRNGFGSDNQRKHKCTLMDNNDNANDGTGCDYEDEDEDDDDKKKFMKKQNDSELLGFWTLTIVWYSKI
jgi:hypothetical protein